MTISTDQDDLGAWNQLQDQDAFRRIVERNLPMVEAVCRRHLQRGDDIDEAVQAVFIVLARRSAELADPRALSAWLYGTALRVCRNARRAAGSRIHHNQEAAVHMAAQRAHADAPPAWADARPHLDAAIATLNAAEREVVIGHFLEGLPQTAVASRLGISENAARKRIANAVNKLRHWFARQGLPIGASVLAAGFASELGAAEPALVSACSQAAMHPAGAVKAAALANSVIAEKSLVLTGSKAAILGMKSWLVAVAVTGGAAAAVVAVRAPSTAEPPMAPTAPAVATAPASPAAGLSGLAARYPGDVGIAADPAVLFADGFEGGDFSRWDDQDGNPAPGNQIVSDPQLVHGGRRAAQLQQAPGAPLVDLVKWLDRGHDQVHVRWYCRYAVDPDPGIVLAEVAENGGCLAAVRSREMLGSDHPTPPDGTDYFSSQIFANLQYGQIPVPGLLTLRSQYPEMPPSAGAPPGRRWWGDVRTPDRPVVPTCERWHCLELRLAANTPGRRDGEAACWLDGEPYLRLGDLRWRDTSDLGINAFWLRVGHLGDRKTNIIWVDDIVIATCYIGPMVAGGHP